MGVYIGTVTKLIFESISLQVFKLKTSNSEIKIANSLEGNTVSLGDHIHVSGVDDEHPKYGLQFVANEINYIDVSHDLLKDFLMTGNGIGESIAKRLLEAFPHNLIEKLESKDIAAISNVKQISRSLATVLVNNWHSQAGKAEIAEYISEVLSNTPPKDRQLIKRAALKAFNFYAESTIEKLNDDPYRLWAFSNFKYADKFATALGVEKDDQRRLICAVEEAIFQQINQGNTQVFPLQFIEQLEKLVGNEQIVNSIIAANDAAKKHPPRIIVRENKPNTFTTDFSQKMYNSSRYPELYSKTFALPGIAKMETYVSEQLKLRANKTVADIDISNKLIENYTLPNGTKLSKSQKHAVSTVLKNAISVISGGAGTGKTSILYAVNSIIKIAGKHVLQVALSGKAAQRLIQQTEDDACTITKLLSDIHSGQMILEHYDTPVFHIDEASMVDILTMYRVLKTFEGKDLRLVFIGDWAQLRPIGPGLIFHELIKSKKIANIELKENFRSEGGIVSASNDIKNGHVFPQNDQVQIIEYSDGDNYLAVAEKIYEQQSSSNEVHVIAALKRTVASLNIALHKHLRKRDKKLKKIPHFKVNDPVIFKKNCSKLELVNGSTGRVIESNTDSCDILVEFSIEGIKPMMLDDIIDKSSGEYYLQHAYAMTCHSAQGSEFDVAIIVVEDIPFVERSWLYTALTRAKKRAFVIVKKGALKNVLKRGFEFKNINVGMDI